MRETKDINFLINDSNYDNNEGEKKKQSISAVNIAIFVVVLLFALATLLMPKIYLDRLESQVTAIENQIADAKYAEINAVKAELSSITQLVQNKKVIITAIDYSAVNASQTLMAIKQAMPYGCYFTKFVFDVDALKISIKTDNSLIASEFMGNLDRLKLMTRETERIEYETSDSNVLFNIDYKISETEE